MSRRLPITAYRTASWRGTCRYLRLLCMATAGALLSLTSMITRGGSNQVRCPEQLLGGRDSVKGGRRGAWALPVAPGLYRAVPAGTRLARITSRSGGGSFSGPVVSGHRGNSARDTLISARRASCRRVSRGV
jgi:hypothetical protein